MSNSNETILVTGATGHQGGAVARHLLQRGFHVRALVAGDLDSPKAAQLKAKGAEIVAGDFDDRASLERALRGAAGVFSVQGIKSGTDTEIRHGKAIADAAQTARVEHFVYSSASGADQQTGVPHLESKSEIEEYLRCSDLPHTILRPAFFFFNYNEPPLGEMIDKGRLRLPLESDKKLQQLSEDNYGEMIATVFERRTKFFSRALEAANVEMTMTEVAAAFSLVTKRKIEYQQTSWDEFEKQAGAEATKMYHWLEDTGGKADLATLRQEFHGTARLESYLRDHGWARWPEITSEAYG